MAVTLNANTSTGFIATSDTSGVLQLQTGGTTAVTISSGQVATFAQAPVLPAASIPQAALAANVAGTGPAFRAYQTSAQSVSAGIFTKVAFSAEDFDTNSAYNTSTYTFLPTVAGYYQINCHLLFTATTSIARVILRLTKNGAESGSNGRTIDMSISAGTAIIISGSDLFYLNGSSDYIEVFGWVSGSGTFTMGSNDANTSVFTGALVRSA